MNLIESILTKNPCYTAGRKITVQGLMLHSVGCSQPSAAVFIKNWNKESYSSSCVHGFIDGNTGDIYQTLPWNHRGWHGGGSSNNTHIGVEMCEPATIKYTGGANFTDNNPESTKAVVMRTYNAAVELFAYLCKEYSLDPLKDGVIISHAEGYKRGVASNHADPEHLWKKFGLTMDGFRKAVQAAIAAGGTATTPSTENGPQEGTGATAGAFSIGDEVDFTGSKHYTSSYATANSKSCKAGKATITAIAAGKPHPYHCVAVSGTGSTVHGWVDEGDISALITKSIQKGDKVKVLKNATYNGGTFKVYYDTYDVIQVNGDRVVIGIGKTVTAAVNAANLQVV